MMYFIIVSGFLAFISNREHVLNMLLSLEFIVLGLFVGLLVGLGSMEGELYFMLYYLSVAACEGALGLGVIVSLIRTHGSDFVSSMNIIQC